MVMFYDDGTPIEPSEELDIIRDEAYERYLALCRELRASGDMVGFGPIDAPGQTVNTRSGDWVKPAVEDRVNHAWDAYIDAWVAYGNDYWAGREDQNSTSPDPSSSLP